LPNLAFAQEHRVHHQKGWRRGIRENRDHLAAHNDPARFTGPEKKQAYSRLARHY
jgi:hypothetical protein